MKVQPSFRIAVVAEPSTTEHVRKQWDAVAELDSTAAAAAAAAAGHGSGRAAGAGTEDHCQTSSVSQLVGVFMTKIRKNTLDYL